MTAPNSFTRAIVFACAVLFLAKAVFAESVRVTVDRATIWRTTTAAAVMVIVPRGTRLDVRAHQGRWLLVEHPEDPRQVGFILVNQTEQIDVGAPTPTDPSGLREPLAPTPHSQAATPSTRAPSPPSQQQPTAARTSEAVAVQTSAYVYGGIGIQATTLDYSALSSVTTLLEQETRTTNFGVGRTPGFETGAGVPVAKRFVVGGSYSHRSAAGTTHVAAAIPSPIFFARPRNLEGDAGGNRTEDTIHVHASFVAYQSPRLSVAAGGGPSFFFLKQDVVDRLSYTETYPYDAVEFRSAQLSQINGNALGFNVQTMVYGPLSRRWDWVTAFRWGQGDVKLDGLSESAPAGHGQFSAGVRYAFR